MRHSRFRERYHPGKPVLRHHESGNLPSHAASMVTWENVHSTKKDAPWSGMIQIADLSVSRIHIVQHKLQSVSGPHSSNLPYQTHNLTPSNNTPINIKQNKSFIPTPPQQARSWRIAIHVLALRVHAPSLCRHLSPSSLTQTIK
jgi:hypothetical protein